MPPSTSGIAAYSAEVVPLLQRRGHSIETFTETNAHDFVWKQRRIPYDLTVFHLGNANCHDYVWSYLFRYPGVTVLHDAQLHQARALFLTHRWKPRRGDYLAEFHANHPEAPPDAGELVAAGLGGSLYHHWPMVRLVIESSRMTLVHNGRLRNELGEKYPNARIEQLDMGVRDLVGSHGQVRTEECAIRRRHGIPADAIVLAAFGGITPEKRIPVIIRALSAVAQHHPRLQLMLVGSTAAHYDVRQDADRWGVVDRVHVTGFVADEELPAYLAAADVCACLRWPTNRETSASWLRCIAAGRATIITDLSHLVDVPTIDPRGWRVLDTAGDARVPVAVSIDLLDEEHSLQLALERLATDAAMRARIGTAGRRWYEAHHRLEPMADRYEQVLAAAGTLPAPRVVLPPHLVDDTSRYVTALAESAGVAADLAALLRD